MSKKKPHIKVVFDSNILFNHVASDLIKAPVAQLIKAEINRKDVEITWYLPEIVKNERQYQMQKNALKLLPGVEKLEKLLGHNLNINDKILINSVEECIATDLNTLKIQTLELDETAVNWKQIIQQSCFRLPPFSTEEKTEKGFRDTMIAETFFQFIEKSPKSPEVCKIVFVTGDIVLKQYIEDRTRNCKNINVIENEDELTGIINTVASNIDAKTIKNYQDRSSKYFFNKEEKTGLYYKTDIFNKINNTFSMELKECPREGNDLKRKNLAWRISLPQFISKERTKVIWSSRIEVAFEIYTYEFTTTKLSPEIGNLPGIALVNAFEGLSTNNVDNKFYTSPLSIGLPMPRQTEKIVTKGKTVFDVLWSVNINTKLTHGAIQKILYVNTIFDI